MVTKTMSKAKNEAPDFKCGRGHVIKFQGDEYRYVLSKLAHTVICDPEPTAANGAVMFTLAWMIVKWDLGIPYKDTMHL